MRFARVVGVTTATVKDEGLVGVKLLVIDGVDSSAARIGPNEVAVDTVGAGVGDVVLVAYGSAARQSVRTRSLATDASVVGIVEEIQVHGEVTYGDADQTSSSTK